MLSKTQVKYLRSLAQGRKVIIRVGQHGLGDNVLREIVLALDHHELVKASLRVGDRQERERAIEAIRAHTGAEVVQKIGHTVTLYRRNPEKPVITLPA